MFGGLFGDSFVPSDSCSGDATRSKRGCVFAEVRGDEDDRPQNRVNPKKGTDSLTSASPRRWCG